MKYFAFCIAMFVFGVIFHLGFLSITDPAGAETPCVTVSAATEPTALKKAERSPYDIKNAQIVDAVQRYAVWSNELNRDMGRVKTADDAAQYAQWFYSYVERFENIAIDLVKNDLSGHTVGFTTKDARAKQKQALQLTLKFTLEAKRLGGINRCLWEGGCMDRTEIEGTIKSLKQEIAEL